MNLKQTFKFLASLIVSFSMLFVFSIQSAFASDNEIVNATVVYGQDTNPHQLSNDLIGNTPNVSPLTPQTLIKASLSFNSQLTDWFLIQANTSKSLYNDDARADKFDWNVSLKLKTDFEIASKQIGFELQTDFKELDKTYVDQSTGFVAVFNGLSVADRYDFNQNNIGAKLSYRPYEYFEWFVNYKTQQKKYHVFEIIGLKNLDYNHKTLLLGMQYQASEQGDFFAHYTVKQRDYTDRRATDIEGVELLDSDLAYQYSTFNLGYLYHPNDKTQWRYEYQHQIRNDNGTGYYDATSSFLSIAANYQLGDYHFIKAQLKYSEFIFENQINLLGSDFFAEDAEEKRGGHISLEYEWIMATLFKTNLALYVNLDYSVFENTAELYSFERSKASLGVRWSSF